MAMRFLVALREIASVEANIFHPYVGRLLLNEDGTLATRGGMLGLRIYDDLERDARVFSCMQKRRLALAAYPWRVEPATRPGSRPGGARRAADLVTRQLKEMNFIALSMGLMDAVLKGFAVAEIMWAVDGSEIRPAKAILRDQRRFRFDVDYQLHLLTYEDMLVGIDLPPRKFVVTSFGSKDGSPYGLGLGTRLFWLVFFKRQDIGFWLAYLDKFGMPTAMGKYPPNTTEALKDKLRDALDAIAQDTGVLVPEGMMIELLEAQGNTANDGYEKLARYMDEQIAEVILGESLTTNIGDSGSKAAAQVHNDVRLELSQADGEMLAEALNQTLVQWIVDLNMPGAPYPRLVWDVTQPDDLSARADRDNKIMALGFKPTLDYIIETYGDGWVEAAPPAAPPPGAPGADPQDAGGGDEQEDDEDGEQGEDSEEDELAAFLEAPGPSSTTATFAERLGREAGPSIEGMVAKVRDLLEHSGSLEEAREKLIDLYPKISASAFADVMTQAVIASDLAGRHEAKR